MDKGFVFASTNYRLLPDGTIKQMGEDVAKAIHWVHDHAVKYSGRLTHRLGVEKKPDEMTFTIS